MEYFQKFNNNNEMFKSGLKTDNEIETENEIEKNQYRYPKPKSKKLTMSKNKI